MEEEIKMIEKNNTWELVDCPHGKDIIGVKWVYKTKLNPDGTIQKHKARLVAKGYSQQPGVDYNETFAPVACLDTIRALISLLLRFMQKPSQIHYGTGKRILRYLQGTREFGIWYKTMTKSRMIGYTDSDWAGSIDDMKSTSGCAFSLGSGFFSWASKKQATVAQSTHYYKKSNLSRFIKK
uniref:Reverse transcriptase Ty1/copia-type domain-containing protein n=1 Tax=Cajanus cajan TaxID=3821 RepID=A0A151SYQ8_CAJCA|nr:hypothetical protein KK1_015383 [Cajanus cajan]